MLRSDADSQRNDITASATCRDSSCGPARVTREEALRLMIDLAGPRVCLGFESVTTSDKAGIDLEEHNGALAASIGIEIVT